MSTSSIKVMYAILRKTNKCLPVKGTSIYVIMKIVFKSGMLSHFLGYFSYRTKTDNPKERVCLRQEV